ncbi:histidine kinase dimerization/phosphoacceptor domain -containing protein [Sphingomonas sp. LY29]|uniref:sensor histidine kinase n=1 Tax=Sphingomonas sp. LY29 TaxID=3095341 RepID=UPI002D768C53|nr:histidine kinase dimerization/phosphoacceptor domain -containing protein [Sphingomonas sp. LY29]WRP25418.1 histidine kinase dimerization/phosphoacceptor domain -containing protein [Sphingomonas sp. LY29]
MREWFAGLPTPAKILLILSIALLPIGLASAFAAARGLDSANDTIEARARDQGAVSAEAIQNLIARNTLAVRVAANAALQAGAADPCAVVRANLGIAPAVGREFELNDDSGRRLCEVGDFGPASDPTRLAPGDFRVRISDDNQALQVRAGVIGGSATVRIPVEEFRRTLESQFVPVAAAVLVVGNDEMPVLDRAADAGPTSIISVPIASRMVEARFQVARREISHVERLFIFLPLLMWAAAAIVSWLLVHRLLIRPLRALQSAVVAYQPGDDSALAIPSGLGPATEIHDLGDAFRRAVERVEGAEHDARTALDGQRRLVREVHHRVKNNLQVVASLLSIHGRSAADANAKEAYSSIGRRVDALSVVHRNHYAELEDNRGIALRPLLTELAAGLRATAPTDARAMPIELDLDTPYTTQDVAVAAAFLVTEIVEFAMLRAPTSPIEVSLRRSSELTATLAIGASVLLPNGDADDIARVQFERILDGLARQLRSPLERKLGRYTVTLPVFHDR